MSTLIPYNIKFNASSPIRSENASLGLPNGRKITAAVRCRFDLDGVQQRVFSDATARIILFKQATSNEFRFVAYAAGGVGGAVKTWTDASLMDGEFHNFVISIDVSAGNTIDDCKIIVDGVRVTSFDAETIDTTADLDMDATAWIVGGSAAATNLFDGAISIAVVYGDIIGSNDDSAIIATLFDSNGNFTDPGLDCSNWFGEPAPVIYRPGINNKIRNLGNLGGDFNIILGDGYMPELDSPVCESRMPTNQAENYVYKVINDITVVNNGDGTSTITSAASGFSVYDAITNHSGLKAGDYVYVTGSTGMYQTTAVAADEITVTGSLAAYSSAVTEYAAVYRIGRRPV